MLAPKGHWAEGSRAAEGRVARRVIGAKAHTRPKAALTRLTKLTRLTRLTHLTRFTGSPGSPGSFGEILVSSRWLL